MTDLILERILARVEHPLIDKIPFLAAQPLPWPERFLTHPWQWTGGLSNGIPMVHFEGKMSTVSRVLYHLMIKRLTPSTRLLLPINRLDVNPSLCLPQQLNRLAADAFPPPETFDPLPDLIEWVDEIDPAHLSDLKPLFEGDVSPHLIFSALQQANLIERLEITTPKQLESYRDQLIAAGSL